jgi:hypothetical protein
MVTSNKTRDGIIPVSSVGIKGSNDVDPEENQNHLHDDDDRHLDVNTYEHKINSTIMQF